MLDIDATAEEMEKKTSGTIAVNRRFRNRSPKGLQNDAFFPRMIPRRQPARTEKINRRENP
jgi:hypothetical protein